MYLQQEYQSNPDQFPFPKEVIQQLLQGVEEDEQQKQIDSVHDIKSEEMVIEEAQQ